VVTAECPGSPAAELPEWDSGWVESHHPFGVEVAAQLKSATRYRWHLQLRDIDASDFSAGESWFETAILSADEFAGKWVGRDPSFHQETNPPEDSEFSPRVRSIPPPSYLRRNFTTSASDVVRARIYATAHGLYELHVNGERIGDPQLAPGWTDYSDRVMYQTFDVTDALLSGENAVGIILADGWWSGYVGYDARRQGNHYGVAPEAWAQLVIDYADGSRQLITTDEARDRRIQ
jgi:alpha-L-rhamnosidase